MADTGHMGWSGCPLDRGSCFLSTVPAPPERAQGTPCSWQGAGAEGPPSEPRIREPLGNLGRPTLLMPLPAETPVDSYGKNNQKRIQDENHHFESASLKQAVTHIFVVVCSRAVQPLGKNGKSETAKKTKTKPRTRNVVGRFSGSCGSFSFSERKASVWREIWRMDGT